MGEPPANSSSDCNFTQSPLLIVHHLCRHMQEVEVKSDNNVFLDLYGVPQLVKEVLRLANIVVPPVAVMLAQPYRSPGTYNVPLALLDDAGDQVSISLQLIPRQASAEALKALGITPAATDEE